MSSADITRLLQCLLPQSYVPQLCVTAQKLVVSAGKQDKKDEVKEATKQKTEERKLAEMMIPKKNKRLYNKIVYSKKKKAQEVSIALQNWNHMVFSTAVISVTSFSCFGLLQVKALHEKRVQYEESIKKKKSKRST